MVPKIFEPVRFNLFIINLSSDKFETAKEFINALLQQKMVLAKCRVRKYKFLMVSMSGGARGWGRGLGSMLRDSRN